MLLHFMLVGLGAAARFMKAHRLKAIAAHYNASYLHQSWDVFVPPPSANYRLFVDFECNGMQYKKDLFEEVTLRHQSNRLAGYGPLLLAFSNSITYFEQSTALQSSMNCVTSDLHFDMIVHAANNYLREHCGSEPKHLKLILWVQDVATQHQRVYFNAAFFKPHRNIGT